MPRVEPAILSAGRMGEGGSAARGKLDRSSEDYRAENGVLLPQPERLVYDVRAFRQFQLVDDDRRFNLGGGDHHDIDPGFA